MAKRKGVPLVVRIPCGASKQRRKDHWFKPGRWQIVFFLPFKGIEKCSRSRATVWSRFEIHTTCARDAMGVRAGVPCGGLPFLTMPPQDALPVSLSAVAACLPTSSYDFKSWLHALEEQLVPAALSRSSHARRGDRGAPQAEACSLNLPAINDEGCSDRVDF